MLLGRKDAWALMSIGAGLGAAHPMFAGQLGALPFALAPGLGAAWLAWQQATKLLDRTDTESREGFILPSDTPYPECMGEAGLRFGFTRDTSMPVDISNALLQRHSAIIGQSGVGKTVLGTYLLWQQTMRGGGWIFIDAKLDVETRDQLAFFTNLSGKGSDMYVLNVDDPSNSHTYNPLLVGDADEKSSLLLNLLPSAENNPGADFYRQSANHALTVIIGALKASKTRYHFTDLAILLQSAQAFAQLERSTPPGPEKMALQVFLDQFRKKTKDGVVIDTDRIKTVLGGMTGRLAQFAQGKFGQVFNTYTPEIDLTDIIVNNKFLYVMLPTMGKDTAALNLGKMILSDLRTAVYNVQGMRKSMRPNPPFFVFADEMGSYVMPGIARIFEQARSANICMMPAFQSFANLTAVSPEFADIIIQNTWNKAFFKFASKDSPETAAEIIGKTKKFSYSLSKGEGESSSAQSLRATPQSSAGSSGSVSQSWRETEDFRVTPDQLKSLGLGEAFIMSGPRVFHIKTPMIAFPEVIPEFKAIKHPVSMPADEKCLNFAERYKEFLMGVEDEAREEDKREAERIAAKPPEVIESTDIIV